jgi:DNA-binding NarL/FixJ family response regulator
VNEPASAAIERDPDGPLHLGGGRQTPRVHTGEIERVDEIFRGIAIHTAARLADRAGPGEVLVSATTRDLATGAGLAFVDQGKHQLKGLAEPRHLFVAVDESSGHAPPGPAPPSAAPGSKESFPAGLTAREVDVLRHVAAGLSDAEAAGQLYLSVRTVNAHLRSIYRKLGVGSRVAASRFAQDNGLL